MAVVVGARGCGGYSGGKVEWDASRVNEVHVKSFS